LERGGSFSKTAIEPEPEAMAGVATATIEIIELSEIRKQEREKIYLKSSGRPQPR